MKPGDEPANAAEEALRARTSMRLLPVVVHRLGNHLAVVQATLALGSSAREGERAQAAWRVTAIRALLQRLESLARPPAGVERSLSEVLEANAELSGLLAEERGVAFEAELEIRAPEILVDDRFELLLIACAEALLDPGAPSGGTPRALRLAVRATPGGLRVVLAQAGVVPSPRAIDVLGVMAKHALGLGWSACWRRGPQALALRLACAVSGKIERHGGAQSRRRAPRVVLLWDPGEERELVDTVLREQGCRVLAGLPEANGAEVDLVLIAAARERAEPGLLESVRRRCASGRIEVLPARPSPAALLALLRG